MDIIVKVIPHKKQRYETPGDWWFDSSGDLQVRVSVLHNWKMESAIAIHEVNEALLCKAREITSKEIDEFDKLYEKNRKQEDSSEPGDSRNSPYYDEHKFANKVEQYLLDELYVDYKEYELTVNALNERIKPIKKERKDNGSKSKD